MPALFSSFGSRPWTSAFVAAAGLLPLALVAEEVTILHVGDQESWLVSAQGNLRDNASQNLSFYGGVDRLASRLDQLETAASGAGRFVLRLNAGDALLPGPRFNASLDDLATAAADGGQDFYDARALRRLGFDAIVFGNHEFDFGVALAARFAAMADTPYLSANLDFTKNAAFAGGLSSGLLASHKVFTTTGGKKVAVIGATTPLLPSISSPETLALMSGFAGFKSSATETANIVALADRLQQLIDDLRANQGVTAVILMTHLQNFERERDTLIPRLRNVDLVVSGGGHELQTNANSLTIPTSIGPALPSPSIPYPSFGTDADGTTVPVVTANFGNRYIGEITLNLNDTTGRVTGVVGSRVVRVSGLAADADRVTGDSTIFNESVQPVLNYLSALNAILVGTTEINLNGERGVTGTPRSFTVGVRNAETNLGNLVADALRFAAGTDVAVQNGGGVRATIPGPGSISVGATFNTLTFLNLVVRAESVRPAQLKAILEHGFAASTPSGSAQGRFPQLSGLEVVYDSSRPTDRVRRVVVTGDPATTADDVIIVDYGEIVRANRRFTVATIDFLANGGDGYPFAANGFVFKNLTDTRNYQEALVDYIETPENEGGLGGVVRAAEYPVEKAFDSVGRTVECILGTRGADTLNGTTGPDFLEGGPGADVLNGATGPDTFVYRTRRDGGDEIQGFELNVDRIDLMVFLREAFGSADLSTFTARLRFEDVPGGARIVHGKRGGDVLVTVLGSGVTAATLSAPANFGFLVK